MTVNIYLSGAVVFIDDNSVAPSQQSELNGFIYEVNETANTVQINDNTTGFKRNFSTSIIADETGTLIGTSSQVRTYLSELSKAFKSVGSGGGGDASSANQLTQITEAQTSNTLLTDIKSNSARSKDRSGALRVSSKFPLFNVKLTRDKRPDFWDEEINGTATSVHDDNDASVSMTVSANGDFVVRQTNQRVPYKTGDPQLIEMTGAFSNSVGVAQRLGYFNTTGGTPYTTNRDGIYFEVTDNVIYCVIEKNGAIVSRVARSAWNLDKLDGTGESGVTLDFTKVQIYAFNFLWLGVDGVTFYLKIGMDFIAVHTENRANIDTGVYMKSPNHSLRYEIRSTGGAGTMKSICTAVFTENGASTTGKSVPVFRDLVEGKACPDAQFTPLIAVRLKDGQLDESYLLESIQLLSTSRADARFLVSINPELTLVGTGVVTWDSRTWADKNDSSLEFFKPANATNYELTDTGLEIFSGYVSDNFDNAQAFSSSALKIGAKINELATDYKDVIVLSVLPRNTETFYGGFNFKEL